MIDAILSTIENEEQRSEITEFYQKYKKRLYSIALSKVHNDADAEDAVQEVFSQIADKPEKFFELPPNRRIAYVDVMVRNISMKMFKTICNLCNKFFNIIYPAFLSYCMSSNSSKLLKCVK